MEEEKHGKNEAVQKEEEKKKEKKKVVRLNEADVINVLSGSLKPDRKERKRSLVLWLDVVGCTLCPYAYIGKLNAERGIKLFHEKYRYMALEVRVRRYPFSLNGPHREIGKASLPGYGQYPEGREPSWHDSLLAYCHNSEKEREELENEMKLAAEEVGLRLDFSVQAQWQPVDSHRAVWFAGRFGKQEQYVDALSRRHFERKQSAVHRKTLLHAAKDVQLDHKALARILDTEEMLDDVWHSFHDMIYVHEVDYSPTFVINLPDSLSPLRPDQAGFASSRPLVINASGNPEVFFKAYEELAHLALKPRYDMSFDPIDDPFINTFIEPFEREYPPRPPGKKKNTSSTESTKPKKHTNDDSTAATATTKSGDATTNETKESSKFPISDTDTAPILSPPAPATDQKDPRRRKQEGDDDLSTISENTIETTTITNAERHQKEDRFEVPTQALTTARENSRKKKQEAGDDLSTISEDTLQTTTNVEKDQNDDAVAVPPPAPMTIRKSTRRRKQEANDNSSTAPESTIQTVTASNDVQGEEKQEDVILPPPRPATNKKSTRRRKQEPVATSTINEITVSEASVAPEPVAASAANGKVSTRKTKQEPDKGAAPSLAPATTTRKSSRIKKVEADEVASAAAPTPDDESENGSKEATATIADHVKTTEKSTKRKKKEPELQSCTSTRVESVPVSASNAEAKEESVVPAPHTTEPAVRRSSRLRKKA